MARFGFHAQPTVAVLSFSESLQPRMAQSLSNYEILTTGADLKFATRDDRAIGIATAAYDPDTNTVTLTPKHRLNLHRHAHRKRLYTDRRF